MSHPGPQDGAAEADVARPSTRSESRAAITALGRHHVKLAVAESLTGGAICAAVTAVPGASEVFVGGIVAYAVELKESLLGVPERLLDEHGPVHPEVARAMAVGVARRCGADLGLATTGVAGPVEHGGKPPGLAYIGWATPDRVGAIECQTEGDRDDVRTSVTVAALQVITQCAENGAARSASLTAPGKFADRE